VQLGQVKQGYNGGGGAGVAASTSDLTLGVSAYLTTSLYQSVLNDISKGANADGRPFGQVMGGGDDVIDAGAGDDWVMAGYGNDTITGGSGNDTMWGRGGAVDSSPPTDNDVYIWNSGNAGTGATDTIKDFTVWNGTAGDRLDITSLLVGYSASKNLSEWITLQSGVTINGVSGSSRMTIDIDGAGTGTARQVIEFEGTNLSAYSVGQLMSAGIMRLAINSAPTLSATRTHPTFTETAQVGVQTAAVALFSGASVSTSDSGQSIKSIELQISGLVDGANEKILIDGTTIGLGANITNSPTTATNTMVYRVTLSGGTATITLTDAQGISASAAASLVNGIRYQNTDVDDPTAGARTVTLTRITDTGGTLNGGVDSTALSIASTVTVVATNDPPTLSATLSTKTFSEVAGSDNRANAVVISATVSVSDSEGSSQISSATVSITNARAGDELLFTDTAKIGGSYDSGTGVLTLSTISGQAPTNADYSAALRSVKFNNTLDTPDTTARTITFKATDINGANSTSFVTETVNVAATNDVPTLAGTLSAKTFTEMAGADTTANALVVNNTVSINDLDGASQINSATVTITNVKTGDVLLFTNTAKISGSYSSSTGVLTLSTISGQAPTNADFSAAMQAVRFNNTSDAPDTTARTIAFKATDKGGATSTTFLTETVNVVATNDVPVLTGTLSTKTFTEVNGADTAANAAVINSTVNLSDSDGSSQINSATVSITNVKSADALLFTNTAKISGSYDNSTGVLTLSAISGQTPSNADYGAALQSVRFNNTSDTPDTTARTITFTATDINGATSTTFVTETVNVVATNDVPTLAGTVSTKTFTEVDGADTGANAVLVNPSVTIADSDGSSQISTATVAITNSKTGDVLLFTNASKISGSYNSATGVLTLSTIGGQTPTNAEYSAALQSVRFNNTSDTPDTAARTITFKATDINGANSTTFVAETVNVGATNDVPTLSGTLSAKTFTEMAGADTGANASVVNNTVSVSDLDGSSQIDSATVSITIQ